MLRRYDIFANKQRFGYQNGRYSKKTATNPQILGFCCTFAAVLIPSPDGGIGRRAGLKHQWGDPCRFDPGSGYKKGRFSDLPFLVPAAGAEPIPFFSSPQRTGRPSGTALARILASPQYVISCITGRRDGQYELGYGLHFHTNF